MKVVWEPDVDNVYLSSGDDNLALHQISQGELAAYQPPKAQLLDHIGIILEDPGSVDRMYREIEVKIVSLGGAIAKGSETTSGRQLFVLFFRSRWKRHSSAVRTDDQSTGLDEHDLDQVATRTLSESCSLVLGAAGKRGAARSLSLCRRTCS
jgi:hypothetical protein